MKKILYTLLFLVAVANAAQAQEKEVKTGWNIGPFPAVGYSSDLGMQYGAFAEIFNFGDGSSYPQYKHKFSVEASAYTKGSSVLSFGYDSEFLIPKIRTTFTVSYLPDKMLAFHGFNGYMSPYDSSAAESYYCVDREYFRTYLDFQGSISGDLSWAAGLGYYTYAVSPVQLSKYEGAENLFSEYLDEGIISAEECAGKHLEFRAGLVHDTRDAEADPTRGVFTELLTVASPDFFEGEDASFAQLSLTHRGYLPIVDDRLTFAYRMLYQTAIAGEVPFYHQQNLITLFLKKTYSEGLGSSESIRGTLRNRAVGQGYIMANIELRYRFCHFDFIGQKWYCALNPFVDTGKVVDQFRADEMKASDNANIYSGTAESFHTTAGIGGKVIMNRNFILSAEWGKTISAQDGTSNLILGLNFLF